MMFEGKFNCLLDSKSLTKKFPFFAPIHTNLSSSSSHTLHPCNLKRKHSTLSISQSLSHLEKQGAQQPPSEEAHETSSTQASLEVAIANKEGKDTLSGSSPHHLFNQISLSSHYPLKKQLYYLKCPNPFGWFSIIQPHPLRLLRKITTLPHHPHIYHWSLYATRPSFPPYNLNSTKLSSLSFS